MGSCSGEELGPSPHADRGRRELAEEPPTVPADAQRLNHVFMWDVKRRAERRRVKDLCLNIQAKSSRALPITRLY